MSNTQTIVIKQFLQYDPQNPPKFLPLSPVTIILHNSPVKLSLLTH